jgi:oligopeptide/dipeptide ABC transporter ATP-binding protein
MGRSRRCSGAPATTRTYRARRSRGYNACVVLLQVEDLRTYFDTPAGTVRAVDGVTLTVSRGRTVALVGESGCGKTLTALSILRLLPPAGRIVGGRILFDGRDLLRLSPQELRAVRGDRIAMIFQEPMTSLNPLLTIEQQVGEGLRLHRRFSRRAARERTVALLRRVGLPAPEQRCREYPHQLSGGMRQRVMIAAALACEPELLIADEPTTALDVTVQAQILALLAGLQRERGMAMLFITHDLGVVARIADEVCVMYAGRLVERGPTAALLSAPRHPYTQALLRSLPRLTGPGQDTRSGAGRRRLPVIAGEVPRAGQQIPGCRFHPRCELGSADPLCRRQEPALTELAPGHACACWKASSGGGAGARLLDDADGAGHNSAP